MLKIFLCGLPNVGKTTVGKHLAHILSLPFIDVDQSLIQLFGNRFQSHKDVFRAYGEQRFRRLETQVIYSLPKQSSVIALGGGSMMVHEIEKLVLHTGTLIFLSLPIQTIIQRLQMNMPESLKQDDNVLKTLQHRHQHMQKLAHYTCNMDRVSLNNKDSVFAICRQISSLF